MTESLYLDKAALAQLCRTHGMTQKDLKHAEVMTSTSFPHQTAHNHVTLHS